MSAPILALGKWRPSQTNTGCNKDSVLAALKTEAGLYWNYELKTER